MKRIFLILLMLSLSASVFAGNVLLELSPAAGDAWTDAREVRTMGLRIPEGQPVSPFLEAGPFRARWSGNLHLEKRSRLHFSMEGTGDVVLKVGDETILEVLGETSKRLRLNPGLHAISIDYQSPASGDAVLQLFWEERSFVREPVPASAFAPREEKSALASARQELRQGRHLFQALQCGQCHDSPETHSRTAPSFEGIGSRLTAPWMAKWIENPHEIRGSARMPLMFRVEAKPKAQAIAAYLATLTGEATPKTNGNAAKGGHLFHEQGCIGCHSLKSTDADGIRISLGHVASKFKAGALQAFLKKPYLHHASSRMPDFGFSDDEAAHLAVFLCSLDATEEMVSFEEDAEQGKRMMLASGCLHCHEGEGFAGEKAPELVDLKPAIWRTRGCLNNGPFEAPLYTLTSTDRAALIAYGTSPDFELSREREVLHEVAERQWEALQCSVCHDRDGVTAGLPELRQETVHLKLKNEPLTGAEAHAKGPPDLTHMAGKLQTPWLTEYLRGHEQKVRPWVRERMPAFPHFAEKMATGLALGEGFSTDYINVDVRGDLIAAGQKLAGPKGIVCGACHEIGEQPALGVFEGQGPNLKLSVERLRPAYYLHWMHDPQRWIPGTVMPTYARDGVTPFTSIFEGDAEKQFKAIFLYLKTLEE